MAGYHHYSKSNNAIEAEIEGKFPLSKASKILAEKLAWTQKKARSFLEHVGTNEYHHTSKMYNTTYYYDVSDEFIEENQDKINTYEMPKEIKIPKKYYFKCWNIEQDCRQWDWKITNRDGNNLHDLNYVLTKVWSLKKEYQEQEPKAESRIRIKQQRLEVLNEIIEAIERHTNEAKE